MIRCKIDDFEESGGCGSFGGLVSCAECGDMVSTLASNQVFDGGHICAECLAQNAGTMLKCEFCSVVLKPEDLIDMVYCPDCGNIVETQDE